MAEERVDRRLAAILAADIAGYSRLMGADEEGTLRQLKAHRKALVDPKITEHRGRVVKTTGDGMLMEFVSVVDAVRCAVDIQRGMGERNAGVQPDKRIEVTSCPWCETPVEDHFGFCPRCGRSLAALRLYRELVDRGTDEREVRSMLVRAGFEPF